MSSRSEPSLPLRVNPNDVEAKSISILTAEAPPATKVTLSVALELPSAAAAVKLVVVATRLPIVDAAVKTSPVARSVMVTAPEEVTAKVSLPVPPVSASSPPVPPEILSAPASPSIASVFEDPGLFLH